MKNTLLLSYRFKWIGLLIFVPFLALCIASTCYEFVFPFFQTGRPDTKMLGGNENLTDELALAGLLLSLIFMSLARERNEDEYVNSIRLKSFQLAVVMNYVVITTLIFTSYGIGFLFTLYANVPLLLVLFLLIFYTKLKLIPYFAKTRTI